MTPARDGIAVGRGTVLIGLVVLAVCAVVFMMLTSKMVAQEREFTWMLLAGFFIGRWSR